MNMSNANGLRAERFRAALQTVEPDSQGCRITDAVYVAGFSGPNRARDAAPLGMAAKSYRARGRGERIGYVVGAALAPSANAFSLPASLSTAEVPDNHDLPLRMPHVAAEPVASLGTVLVAATERGVCAVLLGDNAAELMAELQRRFPVAELYENASLEPRLAAVLQTLVEPTEARELPLDLRGTVFQARVWAALAAIPRGETRTYTQVAAEVGNPKAVRAVAHACAENPAALLVPCHRVIGSNGKLTGYRWGLERKRALLAMERQQGK